MPIPPLENHGGPHILARLHAGPLPTVGLYVPRYWVFYWYKIEFLDNGVRIIPVFLMSTPTQPFEAKLWALEMIRGLGAIIVLTHHLFMLFFPFSELGIDNLQHASWEVILRTTPLSLLVSGRFAVNVFFILSGVVLSLAFFGPNSQSDSQLSGRAIQRIFRLAPMVAAGTLLSYFLHPIWMPNLIEVAQRTGMEAQHVAQASFHPDLLLFAKMMVFNLFESGSSLNSPLWTIAIELKGSYLVYLLVFALRKFQRRAWVYAFCVIAFRNSIYLTFLCGVILADLYMTCRAFRSWSSRKWISLPLLLVSLCIGSVPFAMPNGQFPGIFCVLPVITVPPDGWTLLGALLFLTTCLGSPDILKSLECSLGRFLGQISYALYATHWPIVLAISCSLFPLMLPKMGYVASAAISMIAAAVASIALAKAFFLWVDLPSIRFSRAIGSWLKGST